MLSLGGQFAAEDTFAAENSRRVGGGRAHPCRWFSAAMLSLGGQFAAEDTFAAENLRRVGGGRAHPCRCFSAAMLPLGGQNAAEDTFAAENWGRAGRPNFMSDRANLLFDFRSGNSGAHIRDVHLPSLLQLSDSHHLVRRDAARRAGISPSAWSRAHGSGLLEELQPGVSRIVGLPAPPHQDLAAAVAAAGEGAVASMRSASRLWGVELPGDEIDVTLPGRRHPRLKGVAIHRPTDLGDLRAVRRLGIPTTNPLRTSLDIGAVADPDTVGLVVEHFLVMKSFQLSTLNRAITRHSARGRAGLGHLRLLLNDWCLGGKPPDSILEPAVGRLLADHGLPTPIFHHVLGTRAGRFELDFAFVPQRVDLEVDGWATHGSRRAFEADRARDAYITGAGWVVVRVTWFQVMRRPGWVAARLTEVLQQR